MITPTTLALALAAGLSVTTASAAAASPSASSIPVPEWSSPQLSYKADSSFRGLTENGLVEHYDASGHAAALPGVHDFIRLVPATPLAHGALFTSSPLDSPEWVVELAFRVHGPTTVGVAEKNEDGTTKKVHKGGRGLAFWYTKAGLPGPVTLSSNAKTKLTATPPTSPLEPSDPSDASVSLFGNRAFQFDGLGVVFDTSPQAPVYARSDKRASGQDERNGVSATGVVSGIMDDGSGSWLEPEGRVMKADEEASYLEKAIGECEAAFRNAQGLLWARISHVNQAIRVDLDLSPHTTLAKAGRDYAHNCFYLPGVSLPKGNYLGVSALASGNTEPDAVDIYAMDVFEVVPPPKEGEKQHSAPPIAVAEPVDEPKHTGPLEGTSNDAADTLAHEIFLSQQKMIEAIDLLTLRVEALAKLVDAAPKQPKYASSPLNAAPGSDPNLASGLARIDARIDQLTLAQQQAASAAHPDVVNTQKDHSESFTHLVQLQDRLMVELKSFGRKLDNANGQSTSTLATLSSRTQESLILLQRATSLAEDAAKRAWGKWSWLALLVVAVGTTALVGRRKDGWGGRRQKGTLAF